MLIKCVNFNNTHISSRFWNSVSRHPIKSPIHICTRRTQQQSGPNVWTERSTHHSDWINNAKEVLQSMRPMISNSRWRTEQNLTAEKWRRTRTHTNWGTEIHWPSSSSLLLDAPSPTHKRYGRLCGAKISHRLFVACSTYIVQHHTRFFFYLFSVFLCERKAVYCCCLFSLASLSLIYPAYVCARMSACVCHTVLSAELYRWTQNKQQTHIQTQIFVGGT